VTSCQQCTGKVVTLNIQSEIIYSITGVEFTTTMALVVLMEQSNFVSAGTDTEATAHFTIQTGRGLVVRKLECKTYNWRFETNRSCLKKLIC